MTGSDYSEKYVLFIDILGFSAQVVQADTDLEVRKNIIRELQLIRDTLCNNPLTGFIFTHFSDCIVASSNRSAEGLRQMLSSIKWLTLNLLNHGCFVRGGLTVGLLYHDNDLVFGRPFIEAHELEKNVAIYPRTVVSESVLKDINLYGVGYKEHFLEDFDGQYFFNYMTDYRDYTPNNFRPGTVILDYSANHIINHIHSKLNQFEGRPLEKAIWFQNYWNKEVASQGVFPRIEKDNGGVLLEGSPTIIKLRVVAP